MQFSQECQGGKNCGSIVSRLTYISEELPPTLQDSGKGKLLGALKVNKLHNMHWWNEFAAKQLFKNPLGGQEEDVKIISTQLPNDLQCRNSKFVRQHLSLKKKLCVSVAGDEKGTKFEKLIG